MSLIASTAFTSIRAGYSATGEIISNDPTSDSGSDTCNQHITWTLAAAFLLVATSAFAQGAGKAAAEIDFAGKAEEKAEATALAVFDNLADS
jgi:hypothetical protein